MLELMLSYGTDGTDPLPVLDAELGKYRIATVPRLTLPHLNIPYSRVDRTHSRMVSLAEELCDSLKDGPVLSWPPWDHLCD